MMCNTVATGDGEGVKGDADQKESSQKESHQKGTG
jgi:hypothetical protein